MKKPYEKFKTNPTFLFATLLLVILIAEVFVMVILPTILPSDIPLFAENIADGILLTVLVAPILWKLVVSPLRGDLYLAQRRAQIILDSAYRGILFINKEGVIKSSNPAAQRILNISSKEIVNKNYRDLILPLKNIALEEKRDEKLSYTLADGEEKHLSLSSVKALFDNEEHYIFFIEDITEKKKLELALETQKAKAIASARLAVLGEMAGGVAHEINTPLASMKLLIGQTKIELASSDERSRININIEKIDKMIDRIASIVRGMRSIARDGSKDPMEAASLKDIIEDAVGLTREKFYNHNVDLKIEEISEDIKINCRPVEIGQVILNFLSNAYDAVKDLPERWVQLKVVAGKEKIEIIITDSGHGIPEAVAEKMFNPFFTTKEVGKGVGLGLSISMGIVQNHRGTIQLNQQSPNTQFIIAFPAMI